MESEPDMARYELEIPDRFTWKCKTILQARSKALDLMRGHISSVIIHQIDDDMSGRESIAQLHKNSLTCTTCGENGQVVKVLNAAGDQCHEEVCLACRKEGIFP